MTGVSPGLISVAKLDLAYELSDRRRLSNCKYGDSGDRAIVALHGTPGSRHKFGIADAEARRLGLRLISPDRWGYGLSDAPQDAAWLGDYAADIADLAQALNLSCF